MAAPDDREPFDDDDVPRSIFSALWFRALVVILVFGVAAAFAVPYVVGILDRPPAEQAEAPREPAATSAPATGATAPTPTTPSAPATESRPGAPTTASAPGAPERATSAVAGAPTGGSASTAASAPAGPAPASASTPPSASAPAGATTAGERAAAPADSTRRPAAAPRVQEPARVARATARATDATADGPYWVQVGAFRDPATARRLAEKLRAENYPVQESVTSAAGTPSTPPAPTPTDRYDVLVSGTTVAEMSGRLAPRGLTAEAVAGGVLVKPSLPLRDAVALSKELAGEGLKVQVRRSASAAPAGQGTTGETLHRVRVGGFPDRAAAQAVREELERKGYRAFIARGGS